ncbi:MAG: thrombospondin type 3 repeat-containing protein [Candidatus Moraniibacteriota bacterium]
MTKKHCTELTPGKKDTDGDSYSDSVEIQSGFDPLKPAPGDRIAPVTDVEAPVQNGTSQENLTNKASDQIASLLKNAEQGESVNMEDITQAVQGALSQNTEVTLPEIDISKIKIKKAPSTNSLTKNAKPRKKRT